MAYRLLGVALLLAVISLAGCGTVGNLATPGTQGGKVPFGGVHADREHYAAANGTIRTCLWVADMPFSLVGDIVTWPYTAAYTCINEPPPVPPLGTVPATYPRTPALPGTLAPTGTPAPTEMLPPPTPTPDTPAPAERDPGTPR